jgi:hypothetical protein
MHQQNNEPLRITINTFGSRAHQVGRGPGNNNPRSGGTWSTRSPNEERYDGPVTVHVQDGKPLTPLGKKLLGLS